jgi:hypothetical protein
MARSTAKADQGPTWVRSWDTDVAVGRSSAELDTLLRRYGAHGYTVSNDYTGGRLLIGFTLPRTWQIKNAEPIEIKLTVSYAETGRRLYKLPAFTAKLQRMRVQPTAREQYAKEQAERVAWRHVILLVTAGLEAAASGIQTVEEAFFAHSVLPGTPHRVIDVVNEKRKLLTGGT